MHLGNPSNVTRRSVPKPITKGPNNDESTTNSTLTPSSSSDIPIKNATINMATSENESVSTVKVEPSENNEGATSSSATTETITTTEECIFIC